MVGIIYSVRYRLITNVYIGQACRDLKLFISEQNPIRARTQFQKIMTNWHSSAATAKTDEQFYTCCRPVKRGT